MNSANPVLIQAIRGPVLLIVFGLLVALENHNVADFGRLWPVLVIVYGLMKLWEKLSQKQAMVDTSWRRPS
jgi:hypothetical protein